jgi:hypothetical protein
MKRGRIKRKWNKFLNNFLFFLRFLFLFLIEKKFFFKFFFFLKSFFLIIILIFIKAYGFEKPSFIQQVGILPLIKLKDTIAQAQSGTGKTGAFSIGTL